MGRPMLTYYDDALLGRLDLFWADHASTRDFGTYYDDALLGRLDLFWADHASTRDFGPINEPNNILLSR
jgi:hypothetical protein